MTAVASSFPKPHHDTHRENGRTRDGLSTTQHFLIMDIPQSTSVPLSVDVISFVKEYSWSHRNCSPRGKRNQPPFMYLQAAAHGHFQNWPPYI